MNFYKPGIAVNHMMQERKTKTPSLALIFFAVHISDTLRSKTNWHFMNNLFRELPWKSVVRGLLSLVVVQYSLTKLKLIAVCSTTLRGQQKFLTAVQTTPKPINSCINLLR